MVLTFIALQYFAMVLGTISLGENKKDNAVILSVVYFNVDIVVSKCQMFIFTNGEMELRAI